MAFSVSLASSLLIMQLHSIGTVQFGSFVLKSGITSPLYIDMRRVMSHPAVFQELINEVVRVIREKNIEYDVICGVPYAALPLATGVALALKKPLIMLRKEVKDHGTQRLIEGVYQKGQRALIIEDVITSGASILEVATSLQKEELVIQDAIVVVDRQQGGIQRCAHHSIAVSSVFTLHDMLDVVYSKGLIDADLYQRGAAFIVQN